MGAKYSYAAFGWDRKGTVRVLLLDEMVYYAIGVG